MMKAKPSSERKVSRASVTKGACGTENQQKFSVLSVVRFEISFLRLSYIASGLKKPPVTRSPSVALRQLPPGGSHGFVKKMRRSGGKIKPSSGRKVSRVSVTKGACGTEKRQKFSVLSVVGFEISFLRLSFITSGLRKPSAALSPSVASRQLPPRGSLWLF